MTNDEIARIVRNAGGSTLTKVARDAALHSIKTTFKTQLNIQLTSFAGVKVEHVKRLMAHMLGKGLSQRSGQNLMAHLRCALREVGREKFSHDARISNAALGLAGANRDGTHIAVERIEAERRIALLRPGFREAAQLQLNIGLRPLEAVRSGGSLSSWARELAEHGHLSVSTGTKGGKPRRVMFVCQESTLNAARSIAEALAIAKTHGGSLIESTSLEGAVKAYSREMARVGFKGLEAPHALRYTWAQEQYARIRNAGIDESEALTRLSLDLGHGDGRGRYCKQTYLLPLHGDIPTQTQVA